MMNWINYNVVAEELEQALKGLNMPKFEWHVLRADPHCPYTPLRQQVEQFDIEAVKGDDKEMHATILSIESKCVAHDFNAMVKKIAAKANERLGNHNNDMRSVAVINPC